MKKLHSIQALRGIAALLVVIDHGILLKYAGTFTGDVAQHLGEMGVQIFFIISGLIMVHSSYNQFGVAGAPSSFIIRRIIRVVPLYWILTLVMALNLFRIDHTLKIAQIVKSLFFIPYSQPASIYMLPVLWQGWSLNFEMLFYAVFSICLLFSRRIGLTVLSVIFLSLVLVGAISHPSTEAQFSQNIFSFFTSPIMLLFILGVWGGISLKNMTLHPSLYLIQYLNPFY